MIYLKAQQNTGSPVSNDYKWIGEDIHTGTTDETVIHSFNTSIEDDNIYEIMIMGSTTASSSQTPDFKIYVNNTNDFNTATELSWIKVATDDVLSTLDGGVVYLNKKIIFNNGYLYIDSTIPTDTPAAALHLSIDAANVLNTSGNRKILRAIGFDPSDDIYFFVTNTLINSDSSTYLRAVTLKKL